MTKYVINSGGLRDKPGLSKKFFGEVTKDFGKKPKILICLFAVAREQWEEKYQVDLECLPSLFPIDVTPFFNMAFPGTFEKQISESDVIYIHGGDDHLMQYWLRQFDLPTLFDGKTVATNSASSNAISTNFWTCDWRKCMDGLGMLPIKIIPHYKSDYGVGDPRGPIDWQRAYDELTAYGDTSLPIHALKEGEFIVQKI